MSIDQVQNGELLSEVRDKINQTITKVNTVQTNAAAINDSAVSATTTWSSQKIDSELGDIGTILDQINGV